MCKPTHWTKNVSVKLRGGYTRGTARERFLYHIIVTNPFLMLSSLWRCLNAVHAYYNCCPSYTLRITSRDLLPQKTCRLAALQTPHEEQTECIVPALKRSVLSLEMFATAFPCGSVYVAKMGSFWLSAGLEYLPSGIPGLASAAPTVPTIQHIGPSLYH